MNITEKKIDHAFDCYRFEELSSLLLYKALKLRSDIFVVEQNCVYPDLDDKDIHPDTLHLLLEVAQVPQTKKSTPLSNDVVAYARCIAPGVSYTGSSIGRVAVSASARGNGLARLLMLKAINVCMHNWPEHNIQIGAQVYLQNFYTQLGFIPFSEPYDEDGIMHIDMEFKTSL